MMRALVLTPQIGGADGVSALGREIVAALRPQLGCGLDEIAVASLHETSAPGGLHGPGMTFAGAGGSRTTFAAAAMSARGIDADMVALVLHTHLLPVALPLVARGARVVPMLLGIEAWTPLSRLQRAAMRRARRVAAISQHTVDRFRAANPALAHLAVGVCHPGIDPDAPEVGGEVPVPDEPFALIVGRMSAAERYKGHDELLEAWPAVAAAVPGARLVVAGTGDDEPRLQKKAASLGVSALVRFEGRVREDRLAVLYARASMFVMPSRDEGFGLVYLEAMRAATPCIASRGAAEEIVEDGVSGLIVDPEDAAALGAAVVRLFTEPELRASMGAAARARVRARFTREAFASRLQALMELPTPEAAAC